MTELNALSHLNTSRTYQSLPWYAFAEHLDVMPDKIQILHYATSNENNRQNIKEHGIKQEWDA